MASYNEENVMTVKVHCKIPLGSELFELFEIKTIKKNQENNRTKVERKFGGLT